MGWTAEPGRGQGRGGRCREFRKDQGGAHGCHIITASSSFPIPASWGRSRAACVGWQGCPSTTELRQPEQAGSSHWFLDHGRSHCPTQIHEALDVRDPGVNPALDRKQPVTGEAERLGFPLTKCLPCTVPAHLLLTVAVSRRDPWCFLTSPRLPGSLYWAPPPPPGAFPSLHFLGWLSQAIGAAELEVPGILPPQSGP